MLMGRESDSIANNCKATFTLMGLKYIVFFFVCLFCWQCKDKTKTSEHGCTPDQWDEPPNQVMSMAFDSNSAFNMLFNINKADTVPLGYKPKLVYYKNDTGKVYLDYIILTRATHDKTSRHFLLTGEMLLHSYQDGIKKFYIDWPNGMHDSLYVDFIRDDTKDNSCCCQYPLQSMQLNNQSFKAKTDHDKYGIYIFER